MIRAALFLLFTVIALGNVLLASGVADRYVGDLRKTAAVLGLLALLAPLFFAIALGRFTKKKGAKLSTRYLLGYGLIHAGLLALMLQGLDMDLAHASLTLRRLAGATEPPLPPPTSPPPTAETPPTQIVDAGAATTPPPEPTDAGAPTARPDGGVMYRWEDESGTIHFAKSLEDVPLSRRGTVSAIALVAETSETPPPPPAEPTPPESRERTDADRMLTVLNTYRKIAGLRPVTVDKTLSKALQKHADYIKQNQAHPSMKGLGVHDEKPELPGYTEAGAKAGRSSVITFDTFEKADPIYKWMGTFFHRIPLLRPSLTRTGYAYRALDSQLGHVWLLHVGDQSGPVGDVVLYPVDGQEDVPTRFAGNESPNPIPHDEDGKAGYPITITFPIGAKVAGVSATFENSLGTAVDHYLSTPESPVVEGYQMNTICIIAEEPLEPKTRYRLTVAAIVSGNKWSKDWTFVTAKR